MFFIMLFVLGISSVIAITVSLTTILCDYFEKFVFWQVALVVSVIGFLAGLIYVTPTGQWFVNLIDHFGGTLLIFGLCIFELIGVFWIYGKTTAIKRF